ncbi:MAG: YeeE/YedE family protein [Candidatus Hodarchaeales archaeon]|jgi:uncharacterized membrane protein YedE/YeeE
MALSILDIMIALAIGVLTGFVLQRGRVCANTAFRNILLIGNFELSLTLLVTVATEFVGYQFLAFNIIPGFTFTSSPISLSLMVIIGGFIFGFGTVIAGGCAGGTCYRIGEGSIKSLLAFVGFATGIGIVTIGPIAIVIDELRDNTSILIDNRIPSLEMFLPRWIWTLFVVVLVIFAIYRYIAAESRLKHLLPRWTPVISGFLLGIIGILARYTSSLTGRSFGFSTTDGIGEIFAAIAGLFGLFSPTIIGWAGYFIIGLILGATISSIEIGEFKLKIPNKKESIRFFGGGILLGTGAMIALGCNFGHILGGIPELGISSIVALVVMVLGNWVGSHVVYNVLKENWPVSTPRTT